MYLPELSQVLKCTRRSYFKSSNVPDGVVSSPSMNLPELSQVLKCTCRSYFKSSIVPNGVVSSSSMNLPELSQVLKCTCQELSQVLKFNVPARVALSVQMYL
ncbi:hypothetical protein DPMN_037033 [Dreissena polymorpha]|uniref:Uncharacterized protein n=1 Tax=Dreissena polymorpha TaxID=45954 RepID=A0A9D4RNQ5_DREPO|nr:hypothetical protein DPMN_037033 [Dreissena polymorpha]